MPRPTIAQVAYGSLTVVLTTVALLLATDARSGAAVAGLAAAGLLAGLLMATALAPRGRRAGAAAAATAHVPAADPTAGREPVAAGMSVPRARVSPSAERRVTAHSLRR
ncbi:hypothetical protein [Actinacidiphila rubida]|uniref:Uncharacterized protein n=1 Tax=Actinacidiphila rubida TaxID=310780 RepID=A0A1H8HX09_9ACTN|nr:hypothetical protein [Actinacidiphila rubida]SEN60248.1 hypothetical protein SAMN05216267_100776 [Actinacidiphila rubida]